MDNILKQLEVGIPENALTMLEIPISLERGEYLALHSNGAKDMDSFWRLSEDELTKLLPKNKVESLEQLRPESEPSPRS